jgi:hypothetical protein
MSVVALRALEQKFLKNDGKIDQREARALLRSADDPVERDFLRAMRDRDSFTRGAQKSFDSKLSKPEKLRSLGTVLGKNNARLKVVANKTLSPPEGFDNEIQARTAAGVFDGTAVVTEDLKGRWHAYGTNVPRHVLSHRSAKGFAPSDDGSVKSLGFINESKPKLTWKEQTRRAYDLRARLEDGDKSVSQAQVDDAFQALVARATGVDPSKIHVSRGRHDRKPGKINFQHNLDANGRVARHDDQGKIHSLPSDKTTKAYPGAMTIGSANIRTKEGPAVLQRTIFHEATHLAHSRRSDALLAEWRESGSKKNFYDWAFAKARKGELSNETFATTMGAAYNSKSSRE